MKILLRAVAIVLLVAVIATTGSLSWLFFYSGDLPDLASLISFVPHSPAIAVDLCSRVSIPVIPSSAISSNVRDAVQVAEGGNERLAVQISRGMFCGRSMKNLTRDVLEYKAALQLRRRFTSDQLLMIFLNRAVFGRDLIGVESASLHYCGKHTSNLDIAEASLIAGLIRAPSFYSPESHPERAKMRRDDLIQAMLEKGTITAEQAEWAKNTSLR